MRILVTGSEGLIGHELVSLLRSSGSHEVQGFDVSRRGDESVLAYNNLDKLFSRFKPEIVFHLAAIVGPITVAQNPAKTLLVNVMGTRNVLQVCEKYRVKQLIFTSTSEVYGPKDVGEKWLEEDRKWYPMGTPYRPRSAYAISKLAAECMVLDHNGIVARIFNTSGPRQSLEYVIPNMVQRALDGVPLIVNGSGLQKRCFTHVHDTARGLVTLMEFGYPGIWNIGSQWETTILELAERVRELVAPVPIQFEGEVPEGEEYDRVPSLLRMESLGWRPSIKLARLIEDIAQHRRIGSEN